MAASPEPKPQPSSGESHTPFEVLTTALSFPTRDQEQWWHTTGALLAAMLSSCNYTTDQQYQHLAFYYSQLIPRLGANPVKFRSSLTVSGLPMEFSINYQKDGKVSLVRVGVEPNDTFSGTERDPFNRVPPAEMVAHFTRSGLAGFDPFFYNFIEPQHTLNMDEQIRLPKEIPLGDKIHSQFSFGFDFKAHDVILKGYSYPGLKAALAGQSVKTLLDGAVNELKSQGHLDCTEAWGHLADYVESINNWGFHNLLAWDFVAPAKSRLKFYMYMMEVADVHKVEELWTLDGRARTPEHLEGLEYLKKLWDVIDLKNIGKRDMPENAHTIPEGVAQLCWNYEMVAGNPLPFGKPYFPLQGVNDAVCVQKIVDYFKLIGWDDMAATYGDTVQSFYPGIDMSKTTSLLMWISFTYTEKTGVYLSIYYHPSPEVRAVVNYVPDVKTSE
ncbi:hypothetical protein BDW74DRAFT_185062 [Aspergillus multicolor]|uniref:uncharacterized protein n=1 Tax=Aspergillus multicolor TaxID=41759 RepID=UPI003CCCA4D6